VIIKRDLGLYGV